MTVPIIVVLGAARGSSALMKSPAAGMKVSRRAGEHARQRQRQDDLAERRARRRVEVLGRLEQAEVDLLQAHVDRQDHERQEVVGEAADHRPGVFEQPPSSVRCEQHGGRWCRRNADHRAVVGAGSSARRWCGSGSDVKNGSMTRPSSRFLYRPALKAMTVGQRVADERCTSTVAMRGVDERPDDCSGRSR